MNERTNQSGSTAGAKTIALLAAVRDEIGPTIEQLQLAPDGSGYAGAAGETKLVAAVAGIGAARLAAAARRVIEAHRPELIVHLGFAGGLDPSLEPGDMPAIEYVMNEAGETLRVSGDAPCACDRPNDAAATATLLTLDRIAESPRAKAELFATHRAGAVDMETFAVAEVAAEHGVTLRVLRAITDPADMSLPAVAMQWVKDDGSPDMGKAMTYLATHPWLAPTLMKLHSHARAAAGKLAERVAELLKL